LPIFLIFFNLILNSKAIPINEYLPQDGSGKVVPLNTLLGKIDGGEITFTKKDSTQVDYSGIPPLISDVQSGAVKLNQPRSAAPPKPSVSSPVITPGVQNTQPNPSLSPEPPRLQQPQKAVANE